ncbi:MAG: hypothetical protein CFK52_00205 [Chloracidobacterium sp. CP2_5A]|nr:MAG: hypothetical protein CFK52_00205 [Chloracidobacterium sp. CP2_5A]
MARRRAALSAPTATAATILLATRAATALPFVARLTKFQPRIAVRAVASKRGALGMFLDKKRLAELP